MKKLIALVLISSSACAYEVETHGLLTVEAFKISVLGQPIANPLYIALGFDRVNAQNPYLQPSLADCIEQFAKPIEIAVKTSLRL
jgi:hypothetical protein